MVMRRAGNASPDAIIAERTRSRASDTRLVGEADDSEGRHPGRDLYLDVDRPDLDALEFDRGDALDHVRPCPRPAQ
jgi:hypothetical protein